MSTPLALKDPNALLVQAFELFFNPEIERRRQAGLIDETFGLFAAQVIFNVDRPIKVRFNDEVMGTLQARALRSFEEGEAVLMSEIDEIAGMQRHEGDANAGHITVLYRTDGWVIISDLRHNLARAQEHAAAASDFLETAADALSNRRERPFIDCLFSATELLGKAILLTLPDERTVTAKKHTFWVTQINFARKTGLLEPDYVDLFNQLARLRPKARYQPSEQLPPPDSLEAMLQTARQMLTHVQQRLAA